MLPILVVSIIALAGSCTAWSPLGHDAAFKANALLVDTNPNALTLAELIETAKRLIGANQVGSKSVGKILHALVGLEQMVQDAAQEKYTCDSDQIARLAAVHKALVKYTSNGVYYFDENSKRRLNERVVAFQIEYGKECLTQFRENYAVIYNNQPKNMALALEYLADLVEDPDSLYIGVDRPWEDLVVAANFKDGQHVPTGRSKLVGLWADVLKKLKALSGDKSGILKVNPKTGLFEITLSETKQLLSSLVQETCFHYEQQPEAIAILNNTSSLIAAIKPDDDVITSFSLKFTRLSKHAIGNLVCRDMKLIDVDDLAKRITNYLNKLA